MNSKTSGFTLLELVIVVAVFTALAGVSLDLLQNARNKTAYEVTMRRLGNIREAILRYSRDTIQGRRGDEFSTGCPVVFGIPGKTGPLTSGGEEEIAGSPLREISILQTIEADACLTAFSPYWHGPYLPDISQSGDFRNEIYTDGWGNEFRYARRTLPTNQTLSQAVAYVWSPGEDRKSEFTPGVLNPDMDDVVETLDLTSIFDEEAQRRTDAVNGAIQRYIAKEHRLIAGTDYKTQVLEFLSLPSGLYHFLPDQDSRFLYNPWRIGTGPGVATYDPAVSGSNLIGEVKYIRPTL